MFQEMLMSSPDDSAPVMVDREEVHQEMDNFMESAVEKAFFLAFIGQLEGWKTKCKNLHWAAPKKNIHIYLDEFLAILSDYQDSIAEDYQGILGHMKPNDVKSNPSSALNALEMLKEIKAATYNFYEALSNDIYYVGIKSETETFIHNLNKYKYLFELSDI